MRAIVTGGAGFIGSNAVKHYLDSGWDVTVLDDLSRAGAESNLAWLQAHAPHAPGKLEFRRCDIRDARAVDAAFRERTDAALVLHLAAQVAVTTSVTNPRHDFEVNALGTLNVLESTRAHAPQAAFIYSSTNKVYGALEHAEVVERHGSWCYASLANGVSEAEPLDFHSPYGCSKGAADQYVRDYHRIYGLKTVVLRQSCIYGYRQFGVEDQGWVAWFAIAAAKGRPLTIYGDGNQVRDVLFVDDLVACFDAAFARLPEVSGDVLNIGGGPSNVMSLHELLRELETLSGRPIERSYEAWRPGDQKVFVADIRKAERKLGWTPRVNKSVGVKSLYDWVSNNIRLF